MIKDDFVSVSAHFSQIFNSAKKLAENVLWRVLWREKICMRATLRKQSDAQTSLPTCRYSSEAGFFCLRTLSVRLAFICSSVMTSSRGQTRNSVLGPGKQENIPDVFFLLKIPDVLFLFGLAVIQYRL